MFRKFVLSAGAVLLFASSALAADVYTAPSGSLKDIPEAPITPPWAGFYFGAHLGGIVDDDDDRVKAEFEKFFDDDDLDNYLFTEDDDDGKFIGGVHIGYNWQRVGSPLVFGVEGDVDFGDQIDWLATLRARLGFGTERAHLYVTGGVAFAEFNDNDFDVVYIGNDNDVEFLERRGDNDTQTGWVAGVGAEFKLAQNVSLGLEGLYYSFDEDDRRVVFIDDEDQLATFSRDTERDFWQIRGRLTYHVNRDPIRF